MYTQSGGGSSLDAENDLDFVNSKPWMFMKFENCTPNATIGYVEITLAVSFEPRAAQKGLHPV